ncbi:putative helicase senataxin [Anticarsia gemmatalis]|uniref:putative helicase senataxin n=1 Tax=Anticarsia gemmatalis TaxID=129554 RepID=UPI003F7643A5
MSKWKLSRQEFGSEEFTLSEGDIVTVGRGNNNKITLSSAVISRNHCIIDVQNNNALITDLQSSNGIYVGTTKIPPNKPYVVQDSDVIGLGWTIGAPLVNIKDSEKYVFKLIKETRPINTRLHFQSDVEMDDIEAEVAKIDGNANKNQSSIKHEPTSPVLSAKLSLKRKIDENGKAAIKKDLNKDTIDSSIINISDSDSDVYIKPADTGSKKPKLQVINEEPLNNLLKENEIKHENDLIEYDAFNVKQEYLGYDDEPIEIDSESDSESEQWLLRLSQNSPGKPFTKISKIIKPEVKPEDGSYSQIDDDFICNNLLFEDDEEYGADIITVPDLQDKDEISKQSNELPQRKDQVDEEDEFSDDIISIREPPVSLKASEEIGRDVVDAFSNVTLKKPESLMKSPVNEIHKKAQMIEPLAQLPKGRAQRTVTESKLKSSSSKHNSSSSSSKVEKVSCKKSTAESNKEERRKKLKELAVKDKASETKTNRDSIGSSKPITNVKVTSNNRGAFLTDVAQAVVKPLKRKENLNVSKEKIKDPSPKQKETQIIEENIENRRKDSEKAGRGKSRTAKHKDRLESTENRSYNNSKNLADQESRVPLKNLKPLTDSEESFSGKPVSKVGPMPTGQLKKKVRFSEAPPQVREFEIEPGNRMKKTSLVKTTLVDIRQTPVFSLEKITLMKILRWNPHWLEEQLRNNDPPPILGHNNTPMALFHSFVNHNQYVQLVGDLLLMEIWECLTIAYMKIRNQSNGLQMTIESLPPIPSQERFFEIFNLSVKVALAPSETKFLPRVGEIMLIMFGPDNARTQRFFFVHNIRHLPQVSGQTKYLYSISLHATFTEKMMLLRPGEVIIGKSLAYINKELMLFEAMEYLAGSPLSDAILRPEPHHFMSNHQNTINLKSQWTMTLNPSQLRAVNSSVSAALSDKPFIQMVQGPPGTGKSSVICAIVMTYFYNAQGKKQQNRGKILICATSNAAVDGLVIRLLNLRQSLPKPERFRMVRVGRAEAMHAVAADVSSQQLALRDLARAHDQPSAAGRGDEILHLEAKINMWKTAAQDAKDPVRVAYCQGRVADLVKRINLVRGGGGCGARGEAPRPEQLAAVERRIIEGADIVVTTLASAHNYKMRGLKRRIALCIIDEAGQVIEPETLIPLTLDVTRLTLIGDPQQLPGFICSQRAKQHGLSESLFSRLTSCTDNWPGGSPVILLNQQYRMHPDIADYPSRAFYGGMVESIPPARPALHIPPYSIITIASGDKGQGTSGANEMEAWGVTRLVLALDSMLRPLNLNLAVITPYNAHKELIKKLIKTLHSQGDSQVEVNTVDSFQGQERDVVVVSLARSQGVGFLTDAGRMNVLLTRARHALLICLNPHALLKHPQWRTLVEDAQNRNLYKTLPNKMCQPISAAQVPNDDILKYIVNKKSGNSSHR